MEVFFYGLFMDRDMLSKNGVEASNPRKACLQNYTLKIGNRASLLPCKGETAHGLVMTVKEETVHRLYSEPSVADYVPEEVPAVIANNEVIRATCYNLPEELLAGANPSYAQSLYQLAKKQGFPEDYLEKIRTYGIPLI